ncbi:MAG TPA: HupE/UreJ family protein [Thermoanaerobaculia bacterium]|jgi:hydrogenase/urease accessory protein HupE
MGKSLGLAHALALIVALPAFAHEIGTTRVDVSFARDHTYRIELTTATEPLLRRLHRLDANAVAAATHIRFGALAAAPNVTLRSAGNTTIVTYRGDIPRHAGPFTWQYDLTYATYALTIGNARQWIEGSDVSTPYVLDAALLPPSRLELVRQYVVLGFTHIVPLGLDHILFVLGIFLLTSRIRAVLAQVTAFTLAHSITLGLSLYGVLSLPSRIVEPMIALSIACIAIENLTTSHVRPWRVAVVFAFGLLHGLGFAGALRELGVPHRELFTTLIAFNAGVELGQLAVIAAAWLLLLRWTERHPWYRRRVMVPASLGIACAGVYWTVTRAI